ncbi:hypothetical protein [Paraburkholderia dilworthii]|uniref:hypothetical protein n=1 Tax=Paraburkholderia dilworthii TaxID=948106 RepID=UPI0004158BF1|nr:hypothetical protein [Paraburkholderia dilworthii]
MAISLSRSDAEYLDIVRDTLSLRRATLEKACQEWWRMMREHFEFGQRLISSVDWPSYAAKLDDPAYWRERVGAAHRANGKSEESLAILLSLFAHVYDRTCTKAEFGSIAAIPHLSTAELPESAPTVIDGIGKLRRLNWMLGNFYTEDYAYIHLLLVMQHPVLSGSAFTDAKVSDRSGSPFVTIGPFERHLRVVKRRARLTKDATLNPVSSQILEGICTMTEPHRARLRAANDPAANYLLIVGAMGKPRRCPEALHQYYKCHPENPDWAWLGMWFPDVASTVCVDGATINTTTLRATEAVLEWFKTGSVNAAARRLSNGSQVVIEHYIPRQLIVAWNTRIVRRFHNLFLAAAAPPNSDLLKLLDFNSIDEIHQFITAALASAPFNRASLGEALAEKFVYLGELTSPEPSAKHLIVSVSPTSLAALYLYQECAIDCGFNDLTYRPTATEYDVRPSALVALAEMTRARLPNDRDPHHRAAHAKAIDELPRLRQKLRWDEMMIRVTSR